VLIRTATNSETRTVELEEQAASSADARQHLELIVDHAPEALFGMDREGNVRWLNRTATDWLGERADQAVGRPATEAVPVRSPNGGMLDHTSLMLRAAEVGRPLHEEGLFEGEPDAPQRVVASYSAVGEPDGEDLGLVLLRDANVMTESLREQEELAVHLSHELRAPLTTILGYAQLMSSLPSGSANRQTEFAQRISESGDYMLRLVNNLLDLGRIARDGADELPISRVDMAALTRDVVEAHRVQAAENGQELTYAGPVGPVELETADLAVRQVLTNLVANAVKYTPSGGKVRVTLADEPSAVTWQVIDTGIGLSPEEQAKLFTKFFRSQRPEARLIKGTGLGLALTKALIDRLDGSIAVESAVDQGSTFTVRLPRTEC
jgi:signal transduction histidine kinase